MTQGRSYLAGLVTGVAVTGVLGIVGLRATAAPRSRSRAIAARGGADRHPGEGRDLGETRRAFPT